MKATDERRRTARERERTEASEASGPRSGSVRFALTGHKAEPAEEVKA